jgi:hypothetical protein
VQKTVYKDVDEAVEDLTKVLPLIRLIKSKMENSGERRRKPEEYARICKIVDMLSDKKAFAARLEKAKSPDGSVQFSFTPEAWKLFRGKFPDAK